MRTALYREHVHLGAQMVDFCGWKMPLHYGSQLDEHHHVRVSVGMFDVSHMGIVDISGSDAYYYLRYVLANDVKKLTSKGLALYSCLLNEQGGVIDDLIVYHIDNDLYRLVINAGSRQKVLDWLHTHTDRYDVVIEERNDLALIAVQGPDAIKRVISVLKKSSLAENIEHMRPFHFVEDGNMLIARTGYTGEDGVEVMLPVSLASDFWKSLLKINVAPCGLGARDMLRLEAGLNLYGSDMDETTSPLESNLAWTVSWNDIERDFLGKKSLQQQLQRGVKQQLVGLLMKERGMMRHQQKVFFDGNGVGEITSGGFSPILGHSIALARVPINATSHAAIEYRGTKIPVQIVKPPFVKHGKSTIID